MSGCGNAMATRWQRDGIAMATRWQRGGIAVGRCSCCGFNAHSRWYGAALLQRYGIAQALRWPCCCSGGPAGSQHRIGIAASPHRQRIGIASASLWQRSGTSQAPRGNERAVSVCAPVLNVIPCRNS